MDIAFELKALVKLLLVPLPFFILTALIGIFLLSKYKKLGKGILLCSVVSLYLLSISPIANMLLYPLESKHPAYISTKSDKQFIVVMGCYHISNKDLPITSQLLSCSQDRLVEAVRLANVYPNAKIITSGQNLDDVDSNAEKMKQGATALGIAKVRIIKNEKSINTKQEAKHLTSLLEGMNELNGSNTIVVTSAYHMPRTINYFHRNKFYPTPAPSGHLIKQLPKSYGFDLGTYIPRLYNLQKSELAWLEFMGLTIQYFNGK